MSVVSNQSINTMVGCFLFERVSKIDYRVDTVTVGSVNPV